jgi:uncharacterized protein (TIGR02246 family)
MSTITEEATKGLQTWGNAVANRDMDAVLDCYVDGATLWPTLSNELRTTKPAIQNYFELFLPKINGSVEWNHINVQEINETHCVCAGTYTFDLTSGKTGARFTYTLTKQADGRWKVLHHHSSLQVDE